jgi:cysteinyl-tRNA synthetase
MAPMSIRIHDTLARKIVPLDPREPGRVLMYMCGPTVYNRIHIGNARTVLWFDLIRRYLRYRGYEVTYVMNYTDVDDKIIERAKVEGLPSEAIASKYARAFEQDTSALGTDPPDILVRATDHIEDMVKAIEGLVERGVAYEAGGDVYFSVADFEGYGKLSGRSLEDMRAGERLEPNELKRHPLDFTLWKSAKEDEPSWPSPWGPGRPGWHIECSVMSAKYLGMGFDIHGGGSDLIFPHHENEIAQAEALHNSQFARHWMHAGMVQMGAEKMSKSLGNIVLASEAVEALGGEPVRYWAVSSSYRSQSLFSDGALSDAVGAYSRWRTFLESARHALGEEMPAAPHADHRPLDTDIDDAYVRRFVEAMDNDFNSAEAFAVIHDLVRDGNKHLEGAQRGEDAARKQLIEVAGTFLELTSVLGFGFGVAPASSGLVEGLVEYLLELREDARRDSAFDRADAIRTRLSRLGVTIEDTPAGPRWRLGGPGSQD